MTAASGPMSLESPHALQAKVDSLLSQLEKQKAKHSEDLQRLGSEAQALRERLQKALAGRSKASTPAQACDSAFVRHVEWRIPHYTSKVRNIPKNESLWSEKFTVLGDAKCQLEFFPQGRASTSHPNFCALFLWADAGLHLRYRLRVGKHLSMDDDVFESRMGHGHSNFCNLEAEMDQETDSVLIGLEILDIKFIQEPSPGLRLVNRGPEGAVRREAAVLQNVGLDCVEWRIRDITRRTKEVPAGAFLCPPLCSVAGVRDIQLEFYPNGLAGGKPGYCGFYVRCPSGKYTLTITLFVGSAKKGPTRTEFDKSAAKGLPEFCRLEEQIAEGEDEILVGVHIQNPLLEQEDERRTLYI
eukprot:TRINITY_DN96009_c0_g1_i1.p1 TRINITY_DN96009_c0_g1~~TRINITY_DN96009_c0_g1_i1.p1  ORF type:complete len:356 (+),score=75.84 TRINITY_DN96009_c0_g1_i1:52-1119(+)